MSEKESDKTTYTVIFYKLL